MVDASSKSAWLIPISGPALAPLELKPSDAGIVLGRHEQCELCLASAENVSRYHARFTFDSGAWRISDLDSRWGTFVNGVKLNPRSDLSLSEGDLVRITPWTFTFTATLKRRRGVEAREDAPLQTMVRAVTPENSRPLADQLLALLLETAAGIHAAEDEKQLADLMLDAAIRGTGMNNAALLRPLDAEGRVEIVATRASPSAEGGAVFSRSLLAAASSGVVAELGAGAGPAVAESIQQMRISAAICVPLMLGGTVAAYLYLDSRASRGLPGHALRPGASAFCVALGRMASLALSNLKRIDIERRQAQIEADLRAGAEAQRWILPRRTGSIGSFTYTGESRPGRYVGGDFFDVIPLGASRFAVALGDVTGKGIGASVLMTASQGFLHAALQRYGDPAQAVTELNQFIMPRRPAGKFITLWLGVFDAETKTVTHVDAGHGHALMIDAQGNLEFLGRNGALPVGVVDDDEYVAQSTPLKSGSRVLVVSDGIVEQFGNVADAQGNLQRVQFEVEGIVASAQGRAPDEDEVTRLFDAVIAHAGSTTLADDATAVLVRWE